MTTKIEFNNQYVISKIEENQFIKKSSIIKELSQIAPSLSEIELLHLYNKSISIHQGKMQENGNFLETILVTMLNVNKISHKTQVTINKLGIIVGFNEKRKEKCFHILDFVIGESIEIGKPITEYKVISCKTTCRERWTQDDWSNQHYIFY